MNPLKAPQQGPYGEGGLLTGHFAYLSKTSSFRFPSKRGRSPLWNPLHRDVPPLEPSFIHLSKSPMYEPPSHIPGSPSEGKGPPRGEMPASGDFLNISSRVPPEAPSKEPLQKEKLHTQSAFHPAFKVPGRRTLLQVLHTGPLWKEMPISRASSTYPSGSPARKPSLQVPFTELPERDTPPPEPLSTISQSTW
jgi:hypothetical protein